MATMINCPYCGKLTDPQLDSCVHCGGFLKKQSPRAPRKGSAPSQTCPSCGALVREGDFICVACGTNLLTGQKIAEERKKAAEKRNPVTVVLSVLVAAVIVVAGGVAIFLMTRDPVVRAEKLSESGRATEAISLLENHLKSKPTDARAQAALGKLYFGIGDFASAAKSFEQAVQNDPKNRQAGLYAVLSYAEGGKAANLPSEIAILEKMVQKDPADSEAQFLLGLARGCNGDYLGQVDALKQAVKDGEKTPGLEEALGAGLALDKQYTDAESTLKEALNADPGNGDLMASLGHIASLQGQSDEASRQLREALKAGTEANKETLTRLGLLAMQEGKFPEARVLLGQALDAGSTDPATKYFHAVCLAQQSVTKDAAEAFEALSSKPGPYSTRAAIQLARINLAQRTPDRALEALNRITTEPTGTEGAELQTVRGRVLSALGDVESALAAYRKAGQYDPNYAPVHLENGLLQVSRGNLPEGIRELERYLSLVDKNDPTAGADKVQGLVDQLKESAQAGSTASAAAGAGRVGRVQGGVS